MTADREMVVGEVFLALVVFEAGPDEIGAMMLVIVDDPTVVPLGNAVVGAASLLDIAGSCFEERYEMTYVGIWSSVHRTGSPHSHSC